MPIQGFAQPPPSVRMFDGSYQPASALNTKPSQPQKLLIVLQYYAGDQAAAQDLGSLIADLERIRNRDADILIFRRFDAPEFDLAVMGKLQSKFDKVMVETCRRRDGKSYPFASNQMWADLVTIMGQASPWRQNYYAFLPLEPDCTPTHPGWIKELITEWRLAKANGYAAIGFVHDQPIRHLNGVAVYDTNLWSIVGAGKLNGADPQIAFDIFHANDLLPVAKNTPLIHFQYQRPTITAEDLFAKQLDGIEPALFHGVKDTSAREAVRAKYVTFTANKDISRQTVFTYAHHPGTQPLPPQVQGMITLWADGWRSRGWNPVCLRLRDAARNPRYDAVCAAIKLMPCVGDRSALESRFLRFVALDSMGGGLMVSPDVLPGNFTPDQVLATPPTCVTLFQDHKDDAISSIYFPREDLGKYLDELSEPIPAEGRVSTFDVKPCLAICGDAGWKESPLVSFEQNAITERGIRGTTVSAMEDYLRGA